MVSCGFLGWYDIVQQWESLGTVRPSRTHNRTHMWEDPKKEKGKDGKSRKRERWTSTRRSMTLKLGCWTSHLEPFGTGLMSVWCLVATLQTVCHQKTCSLVPPFMEEPVHINPSLLSQFQEDRKRVGGVRGHSSPVEAPGDSYVTGTRPTKNLSLQRSHGGGARGISS